MKKAFLIFTAFLAVAWGSVAAETYTLEECVEMAVEKDPNAVSYRNAVNTAGAGIRQALGNFLPSASFSINSGQSYRGPISIVTTVGEGDELFIDPNWVFTKSYSAGFNTGMTLFDGLQNVWNYQISKAGKRQAQSNYDQTKSNIIFNVKTDYYLVLKAKKDLEVAKQAIKRSEELLKLFNEKYKLGSASLSEVLKQKVQFGNDKLTLVNAKTVLDTRFTALALGIGVDPYVKFDVANIALGKENIEHLDALISKAMIYHPYILSSKANQDIYKYDVRSAWGAYMPRLSLGYSYNWSNNFFGDLWGDVSGFSANNSRASLSLSLNFTIFDGFTRETNMSRAKASLNNAKASYFYARNNVVKNIKDAYQRITLAEETLGVTEETERAASEDMDLVQAKYNLGAAALWELLDAQVSLKRAQFNKVKAEFDYNLALAKLQNAMGE